MAVEKGKDKPLMSCCKNKLPSHPKMKEKNNDNHHHLDCDRILGIRTSNFPFWKLNAFGAKPKNYEAHQVRHPTVVATRMMALELDPSFHHSNVLLR